MNNNLIFCLLLSFIIISIAFTINPLQIVESVEQIERGKNFDRELLSINPDGSETFKWTTKPERLLDYYDSNNNPVYVDFKTHEDNEKIYFESKHNTIIFDKATNTLETYDPGKLLNPQVKMKLSHSIKEAVNGTDIWYDILNNTTPNTIKIVKNDGIQIISAKENFKTIYDVNLNGFEYTYEYINNDNAKTDHKYGFTTVCNGVQCNDITIENESITIGTTKNKSDLIDKNIKIGNKAFDLKNEQHDYTWALKHLKQNELIIDFTDSKGRLDVGDTLIVDPIFSSNNTTEDGYVEEDNNNDVCNSSGGTYTKYTSDADTFTAVLTTAHTRDCSRSYFEWDTTSIPDSATITDTVFKYDLEAVLAPINCDIYNMETKPSTASASTIFLDAGDGTNYISNNSFCTVASNNLSIDLGSSADTKVQANLGVNWFAISIKPTDETLSSTGHFMYVGAEEGARTPKPTLEITYTSTPKPNAVTDLTSSSIGTTTATLTFSAPNLNGESLINYMLNVTTPQASTASTFNQNSSSTTIDLTGLTTLTGYTAQVSAYTLGGANWTYANVYNFTTLDLIPPDAPTLAIDFLNETTARLTSTAGASSGNFTVKDFGVRCELNNAGGWLNTVNNSTLPIDRIFDYIGLSLNDSLTCQWRDGSSAGWSPWSNNATVLMIITGQTQGNTPLNDLDNWIIENGGIYFGMGMFTFAFILIGAMASPKTVPIFTILLMIFAGILNVTQILVLPFWFWGMALLLVIPLVFKRRN